MELEGASGEAATAAPILASAEGAARLRAVVQAVFDFVRPGDLDGLRALDLGAGAGGIAVELALRGAAVIAIEGREVNCEEIRALRDAHGLGDRVGVLLGDVRTVDWDTVGEVDVVVCSGLLYHLELSDAVALVVAIRRACRRLLVLDTEVAWGPVEARSVAGRTYCGHAYREHAPEASPSERLASRRASLDNENAFWLTRASLHALLHDAGFTSSWEMGAPGQPRRERRATLVGLVGHAAEGLALGSSHALPSSRPPEPQQGRLQRARLAVARVGLRRR
jgi:SAM-dependent methyltransferase